MYHNQSIITLFSLPIIQHNTTRRRRRLSILQTSGQINSKALPAQRGCRLSLLRLRALHAAQPVLHLRHELLQQPERLVRLLRRGARLAEPRRRRLERGLCQAQRVSSSSGAAL